MIGIRSRYHIVALAAAVLVAAPGIALAKHRVWAANDGTWDWRHHEPVPSQVRRAERGHRIMPSPEQRQATTGEVENLYRNLMQSEGIPAR